ncbi:MAG: ribonuclease P protein component [Alphaproteobacteria bacterium]|nr:MAG: ribonuclease P protein component [Alphaproteobacteria bacterium]
MHTRKEELAAIKMLTARSEFLIVQGKGKKWVSHGLILQMRPNDLGHIRTGYTVTKKIDKSAVKRNRIKRRLRSVAADVLPHYALDGHDYILVGRKLSATRSYDTLVDDLKWCLRRSGFSRIQEK